MTDYPLSTLPATSATPDKIALANDLHRQCSDLAGQVQALGQRMWQYAVQLGYLLVQIKAETPHGEYTKLFAAPGGKTGTCARFEFEQTTARRYVNLYKAVETRIRKLGDDRAAAMQQMIEQGAADELSSLLGEVSQASSLREAYIELGVIQPPKTPQQITEERAANMRAHHNPHGRPRKAKITAEAELAAMREAAENELLQACSQLSGMSRKGRLGIVSREAARAAETMLGVVLHSLKSVI